jgi:hypothetical protein
MITFLQLLLATIFVTEAINVDYSMRNIEKKVADLRAEMIKIISNQMHLTKMFETAYGNNRLNVYQLQTCVTTIAEGSNTRLNNMQMAIDQLTIFAIQLRQQQRQQQNS